MCRAPCQRLIDPLTHDVCVSQENLQTLGAEIERLIKQQRDPGDAVRRQ